MIILGIDPGFGFSGFGIIQKNGRAVQLLDCGYLKMSSKDTLSVRVGLFYDFFKNKIIKYNVTAIALETSFLGKNAQNFLKLGYLRGIIYLLASQYAISLHEFAPMEVKLSITGFGAASKEQVARVLFTLFPLLKKPVKYDVTDAIAITLCGLWQQKTHLT